MTEQNRWLCTYCGQQFEGKERLRQHMHFSCDIRASCNIHGQAWVFELNAFNHFGRVCTPAAQPWAYPILLANGYTELSRARDLIREPMVSQQDITAGFLRESRLPMARQLRNILPRLGAQGFSFCHCNVQAKKGSVTPQFIYMLVMGQPTALHFPLSYPLNRADHKVLETLCADQQKLKDLRGPREHDMPYIFDDHGLLLFDGEEYVAHEDQTESDSMGSDGPHVVDDPVPHQKAKTAKASRKEAKVSRKAAILKEAQLANMATERELRRDFEEAQWTNEDRSIAVRQCNKFLTIIAKDFPIDMRGLSFDRQPPAGGAPGKTVLLHGDREYEGTTLPPAGVEMLEKDQLPRLMRSAYQRVKDLKDDPIGRSVSLINIPPQTIMQLNYDLGKIVRVICA